MKTYISRISICLALVMPLLSCISSDSKKAEECAKTFASHYFNLRYVQSVDFCTPKSKKWISYKASNISQEDLDVLNSQQDTAECEIESSDVEDDKATVVVNVSHFLKCDTIGKPGHICDNEKFELTLKRNGEKWLVDLHHPL